MAKGKKGLTRTRKLRRRCLQFLDKGVRDPTVKQLLSVLNGEAPTTVDGIQQLFFSVRRGLEKEYSLHVCSVSEQYYQQVKGPDKHVIRESFRKKGPESEEEARMCLPGGRRKIGGLYFPKNGKSDLIYEESLSKNLRQGMMMTRLNLDRVESGLEEGMLSKTSMPRKVSSLWIGHLSEELVPVIENALQKALGRLEK